MHLISCYMASVKVAVRVRPINQREIDLESRVIIGMSDNKTVITNFKVPDYSMGDHSRERVKEFTFDYSYWSTDRASSHYVPQKQVFDDLGTEVVHNAYEGYNACVFAYGQTGSGKTYTMMGSADDEGLIPRICQELFHRMSDADMSYRTEVSYMEIYNEKVRDLLKPNVQLQHSLRVREHPKDGPYVQDLSKHIVQSYADIYELMQRGNDQRTTASTCMNDVSSRSHAIFTMIFTQAKFRRDCPIETHSKIHLVDLAGSERADQTGATGQRLKEGSSINKSLVTLGNVISALAELSENFNKRKSVFIPYRDAVLTWLLKDSLGGNSKTIMIATISPAECNYAETVSTLRYANRAKNILNKPTVNEDPNVRLIRELREEIAQLRTLLGGNIDKNATPNLKERLCESEARVKVLTEEWAERWKETTDILKEDQRLALRREGPGITLDSEVPHLIGIDSDVLRTGIVIYQLQEGVTTIGSADGLHHPDIILTGADIDPEHCQIVNDGTTIRLVPQTDALCRLNGELVTEPVVLAQGAVLLLGQTNMFRFNNPAEARQLRRELGSSSTSLSRSSIHLSQSITDLYRSTDSINMSMSFADLQKAHDDLEEELESKRLEIEELEDRYRSKERERQKELEQVEQELNNTRRRLVKVEEQVTQVYDKHQDDIELEKEQLRQAIADELLSLVVLEKSKVEETMKQKQDLQQHVHNLRTSYEENIRQLDDELKFVSAEVEEVHGKLTECEHSKEMTEAIFDEKRQMVDSYSQDLGALNILQSDYEQFMTLTPSLSVSTRETLKKQAQVLVDLTSKLKNHEQQSLAKYKDDTAAIHGRKQQTLIDIEAERTQLQVDNVYLADCEELLKTSREHGEISKEAFDKEWQALEQERTRIVEEENKLQEIENQLDKLMEGDLINLQTYRAKEVEKLNIERDGLRNKLKQWDNSICKLMSTVRNNIQALQEDVKEQQIELNKNKVETQTVVRKSYELSVKRELLDSKALHKKRELEEMLTSVYEEEQELEEALDDQLAQIHHRKAKLEGLSLDSIHTRIDLYKALAALGGLCTLLKVNQSRESSPDKKLKEMVTLEAQLKEKEKQLKHQEEQLQHKQQKEQEHIQVQRFRLQELEEKERINTLVEQELKRRLFEERVRREKSRRLQQDVRDKELHRVKRAHQREIDRIKGLVQAGTILPNGPTRANPYASVMGGSVTPQVSGTTQLTDTTAQRTKCKSLSNLPQSSSLDIKVAIPSYTFRGSGLDSHAEYEVQLTVCDESWTVFRRYTNFREFHNDMKKQFPEFSAVVFPPKRWFMRAEKQAAERQPLLQAYLAHVLQTLQSSPHYPLHSAKHQIFTKRVLCDFHSFFRKGVFDTDYHTTS